MNYKEWIWTLLFVAFIVLLGAWIYKTSPKVIAPVEAEETWQTKLASNPDLLRVAKCESNLDPTALNAVDSNGKRSVGLLQFQDATFIGWGKIIDPKRKWDIWNPDHQVEIAKWAWARGYESHWGCARTLGLVK